MSAYHRGTRELTWGEVPNVRDLGGLVTPQGPTQFGRIARGPRRELLDDIGWQAARAWGLNTVVDLRCDYEVGVREEDPGAAVPQSVTIISAPTEDHENTEFQKTCFPILDSPAYWRHNLRILPAMVRATLEAIAEATPGVLVHCSAGRDRTGMITSLLLANAGVAPEVIADDYALSVRAMAGIASHQPTHDRQAAWKPEQVEDWVEKIHPLVVDFAQDVATHLDTIQLSHRTRARLRSLLVAPEPTR
ncbi:tyrosine-protein phosphatase [Buchananella hordeovulneris]|uniref:Protein tyrosine phosphatase n=1 Tax=Buchananella hordeovulneris TaxID=52770 RepID=A0A1Q5PTE9_9ACTO|nr:tyrosine-protein phosphatase [Buchananella hordeovulneris]OKL50749.1 protein tyrosine phosphatase [Buchananella hordeovulneris]